ncbi:MAG: histidine--tRNA ligase [Candidatus Hydrogenedentes bacterium]|nr:histidine--tRNA ligase [Candidatus Hydrogenedentota bacterium]
MNKNTVEPRLLKGFQDSLPPKSQIKQQIKSKISQIFENYGFVYIETPAIEPTEILLGPGGENIEKEIFYFNTPEGENVCLRFDHTVPFARLIAQYPEVIKLPFKRYTIGPVWRADKPGLGRYREFIQMDADIAGTNDLSADAEIVSIMVDTMNSLGFKGFQVLINNRKLIDALLIQHSITDIMKQKHIMRVIDKLPKVGIENVKKELGEGRIDESGDPIKGVGLPREVIERIISFITITGDTRKEIISHVEKFFKGDPEAENSIKEMKDLDEYLEALGISDSVAVYSLSLTRGLDYYSGPVFETVLLQAKQVGSVIGGGRYDSLVSRFIEKPVPCTGMSIGLDRLISAMEQMNLIQPNQYYPYEVIIARIGNVPMKQALELAKVLREAGIKTSVYMGNKPRPPLKDQLSLADHYNIPVAVIIGEEELNRGEVCIKDLYYGEKAREGITNREEYRGAGRVSQLTVPKEKVVDTVKEMLNSIVTSSYRPYY